MGFRLQNLLCQEEAHEIKHHPIEDLEEPERVTSNPPCGPLSEILGES